MSRPPRYQRHSATSLRAAMRIEASADTMRGRVYRAIVEAGPARRGPKGEVLGGRTDDELQNELRMNPNTERPRRIELTEDLGIVEASKFTRPTAGSHFPAVVWVAVDPEQAPGGSKPARPPKPEQKKLFE